MMARGNALQILIVVVIAGLLAWGVSRLFAPLTDDELQRMQIEQTKDLPQNR